MFVNRINEEKRITDAIHSERSVLIAVYGRRRCGKSTLLKRILTDDDIYFVADQREKSLQIESFAGSIERSVPGFSLARYPDWDAIFNNLHNSLKRRITICIDEFPYLVKNEPALPSILQNVVDNGTNEHFNIIICGSSQQMMQNMILNSGSPLYGRCNEILNIKPMSVKWFGEYFNCSPEEAIMGYGITGGVPRYWELVKEKESIAEAVKHHILDSDGILYKEPEVLFYDEMRTSVLAYSILTLVGRGCNRLSEIASRLEKPATDLNRPVKLLVDLGYIKKETPFNISSRSTKKSLYKISDPFMNFYFTFVVPEKSRLEYGLKEEVWMEITKKLNHYISGIWEGLCRDAVPAMNFKGMHFGEARRWWGKGIDNKPVEIDIVALADDGSSLLIGEAKWSEAIDAVKVFNRLKNKAQKLPFVKKRKIVYALFLKNKPEKISGEPIIITPADIISGKRPKTND